MAELLSNKDARKSITETPRRANPVHEKSRKNYRPIARGSKRK
jgi:hypothetical protein